MRQFRFSLALLLGVYPTVTLLHSILAPVTAHLADWQRNLVFASLMVLVMVYMIVPMTQKIFARFIHWGAPPAADPKA